MTHLCCTEKLLSDFNIQAPEQSPGEESQTTLGDWYAHLIRIRRCKGLLFVNERALFSFIVFLATKDRRKNLENMFVENLQRTLEEEGFRNPTLDTVMSEIGVVKYARTDNRSVLGSMNDLAKLYQYQIESAGSLYQAPLPAIIKKINRTPQKNLGWKYSIEVLKELLLRPAPHPN